MSSVLTRASIYLISGLVAQGSAFCLWLILPWYLSSAEVGYVTLALFAVEVLTMLGLAGMDAALIRFAARPDARESTLAVALSVSGSSFVLVAGVVYVLRWFKIPFLANTIAWVSAHYVLVIVAVAANILWCLYQSYQVAAQQAREYAAFQFVRAVVYLALGIGGLVFLKHDASVVLVAAAASSLAVLAFFMRGKKRPAWPDNPFVMSGFGPILIYGLPLMLNSILGVGSNYTQRLVIDQYADISTLGVYGFFAAIAIQVNGFWASFNRAWTPEYFLLAETDPTRAVRLVQGMLALVCIAYPLLIAGYVVVGEWFLNDLLFKNGFVEHTNVLYLLLLAPLFCGLYTIAYPIYYFELKTHRILVISTILAAINLGISVVLIQFFGMIGAACSFVLFSLISAGAYLLSYREWAVGKLQVVIVLTVTSMLAVFSVALLIVTSNAWAFVIVLLIITAISWSISGSLAKPLLLRFIKSTR